MLALRKKFSSEVSWAPFYYIMSIVLTPGKLNYFSDGFANKPWKKVSMYGIFFFQLVITVACLSGMILPNNYDLADKISCLAIFITEGSIGLKVVALIYHSATLKRLNEVIIRETSHVGLELWEFELAKKYYKFSKLICVKIIFLYSLTMISFILLPVFSDKEYMMPILMELPGTNISSRTGYVVNYLAGAYGVFYGTTVEMGFDIPAFLQACFISFQLDRCIHYCRMIGDFNTPYDTQAKQSKLLRTSIELHASIFQYINEVAIATVNTSVVALTVITTVPLLTVLLYSVLLGDISASPFLMIASAYHLFMYCFLGEVVSTKCREASEAIYTSQWYKIEKVNDKRTFLFFLNVSHCDMRFSAGGLYKLSLETYTELMKRVYGAYAFLNEVM